MNSSNNKSSRIDYSNSDSSYRLKLLKRLERGTGLLKNDYVAIRIIGCRDTVRGVYSHESEQIVYISSEKLNWIIGIEKRRILSITAITMF